MEKQAPATANLPKKSDKWLIAFVISISCIFIFFTISWIFYLYGQVQILHKEVQILRSEHTLILEYVLTLRNSSIPSIDGYSTPHDSRNKLPNEIKLKHADFNRTSNRITKDAGHYDGSIILNILERTRVKHSLHRTKRNVNGRRITESRRDRTQGNTSTSDSSLNDQTASRKRKRKTVVYHMHAKAYPEDVIQQVKQQESADVDCGRRVQQGLQLHCRIINIWEESREVTDRRMPVHNANGVVIVRKPGLYYVYSQITFQDVLGSWSYAIVKTNRHNQEETLSQCVGMEPHYHKNELNKVYAVQFQCHTSRIVRLERHDKLHIENMYYEEKNRVMRLEPHLSFWGFYLIGS